MVKGLITLSLRDPQELQETAHLKRYGWDTSPTYTEYLNYEDAKFSKTDEALIRALGCFKCGKASMVTISTIICLYIYVSIYVYLTISILLSHIQYIFKFLVLPFIQKRKKSPSNINKLLFLITWYLPAIQLTLRLFIELWLF